MTDTNTPAQARAIQIMDWQKEFRSQPRIYWTESYCEGWECTGNYYESEEAAQPELDFAKRYKRRLRLASGNIHTLALSQQRWNGFQ